MPRYIARINLIIAADNYTEARTNITEMLSTAIDWEYVIIDAARTEPMAIPEPTLDELFDAALDNNG